MELRFVVRFGARAFRRGAVAGATVASIATLAACSGGSGAPVAPIAGARATPTALPTASPTPNASASPTSSPTSSPSPTPSPSPTVRPTPSATPTATPTATPRPTPTPSPTASSAPLTPNIYVANLDKPSITSYAPNPAGVVNEAPLGTIFGTNTGLEDPEGLAIDATGHLYVVANHLTGSIITVYAANPSGTINETPIATIAGSNTGLGQPAGIALDASGRIYVTNGPLGGAPSITVYPANPRGTLNEAPLATITGSNTQLTGAEGLSVDANGKIYVANAGTNAEVVVFPAIPSAGGILDEAPQAVITGPSTGLKNPYDVVVDPSGVIYVVDSIGGGTGAGSIDLFAANPSGFLDEAPIAEITGATTNLFGPGFLALDPSGKIYVSDPARQSIFVYPAHPTGTLDEAPIATIAGSNTGLSAPYGIVVP